MYCVISFWFGLCRPCKIPLCKEIHMHTLTSCIYCILAKYSNNTPETPTHIHTHAHTHTDLRMHRVHAKDNTTDTSAGNILHSPLLIHTLYICLFPLLISQSATCRGISCRKWKILSPVEVCGCCCFKRWAWENRRKLPACCLLWLVFIVLSWVILKSSERWS